ncbi:CPBP family intramembrane glutamic endopeptidase [Nocardia vulneris]|uniref:Abortive infection protein n=1 Tax=Nocardia vulneris TaxID=1141657 RepID=A0ABR4Z6W2_9NOCA|nr:CPBP family intramembrane glutamic endopeptidase [Nocardia vulneris]KIA61017.1 abortive infection protein [Nocardia vulneris]
MSSAGLLARRRRVAVVALAGTGLLGASFAAEPDSARFYRLTLATAATWTLGGRPPREGEPPAPVLVPIALGAATFAVFYGCGLVARRIPFLRKAITGVLRYAERGPTPRVLLITLANGAAEEIFFRGAVYSVAGRHPVLVSTGVYACTTAATRNPALVLASVLMGTLFGLQRRATGGIQAPVLTHLTWSTLMVQYLPRLFR